MRTVVHGLPQCGSCAIRSSALFGQLDHELIDKVRGLRSSQIHLDANEHLLKQGDVPVNAYTVFEGWLALCRLSNDGTRQIIRIALPGDFLGFKLGGNMKYDYSVHALSEAKLCAFPIAEIQQCMAQVPELFVAIQSMQDMVMEQCHSSITSIANKPAESKVAYLFLTLFSRISLIQLPDDKEIDFPMTQEDVSDALGLTSIHVNRVIKTLREKEIIICKNKRLRILDMQKLMDAACLDGSESSKYSHLIPA